MTDGEPSARSGGRGPELPPDLDPELFGEIRRIFADRIPFNHLIGLELPISVLSVALRGEPTGAPSGFRGDVAAVAKRDLAAGERLDGEGGTTVWGCLMPAADSLAVGALPIGLAHGLTLERPVAAGSVVTFADVRIDPSDGTLCVRREMERAFAPANIGSSP